MSPFESGHSRRTSEQMAASPLDARLSYSESRFYSLAGRTFFGLFGALFVSA
jgi:hypothetical protein